MKICSCCYSDKKFKKKMRSVSDTKLGTIGSELQGVNTMRDPEDETLNGDGLSASKFNKVTLDVPEVLVEREDLDSSDSEMEEQFRANLKKEFSASTIERKSTLILAAGL